MKTPPESEDIRRGLSCFHLSQGCCTWDENAGPAFPFRLFEIFLPAFRHRFRSSSGVVLQPSQSAGVVFSRQCKEVHMKKALAIVAVIATVGATTITAPAQARGLGPGLAFGLAAGALAAGAAGAYGPYYGYGPGYGYYGPRYYGPAYYGPGPYAYYGGPYYRHRYYRHW
jgi:hypothetical protein